MDYLLSIGIRIKERRQLLKMTQEELAVRSGYTSRSSINKIERGIVDLPRSKIIAIAEALGTTPTYILFGQEQEEENPPAEPKLLEGEEELLQLIRLMPAEMKALYIETLRATLKSLGLIQ